MVEIFKPSVFVKYQKNEICLSGKPRIYEEWANSVGTGLDKLHGGRNKFALFLTLLSVGSMWRTNTPGWKVRT